MKTNTTTVVKLSLKFYAMPEGNTSIAEPTLEVLFPA